MRCSGMKLTQLQQLAREFSGPDTADTYRKLQEHMLTQGVDLSTFYQELEMSFRYVETHLDTSYSNANMQLHSHVF